MIVKRFDMSVDYAAVGSPEPIETPTLTSYILEPKVVAKTFWKKRPAVIVCPGGGYKSRSLREGEAIALKYCAAGYHAFVLDYSVSPICWPAPQCELSKAVMTVRGIADEYNIDADNVYVCGFSAAGHLAACLGVYSDLDIIRIGSGAKDDENKPNGLILCYPVITDEDGKTHAGTKERFIGEKQENAEYFGLEKRVSADTPKCFIWHTFEDDSVPVYSSMRFAAALLEHGVEFELHIFPKGRHGLALANVITASEQKHIEPSAEDWSELSIKWLNRVTNRDDVGR